MVDLPKLDAQEETKALAELKKRFPKASEATLRGFLRGQTPKKPPMSRPESEADERALQQCLDLVNSTYEAAVKEAQAIKPDWLKAAVIAGAIAARFFGNIQCYSEHG